MTNDDLLKKISKLENELTLTKAMLKEAGDIRSFIEASGEIILETDTEGRILYANHAALETFEATLPEISGKKIQQLIMPDYAKIQEHLLEKYITERKNLFTFESLFSRQNGETFWLEFYSKNIYGLSNSFIGFILKGHNITTRKNAETRLIESEERWRYAIEGAGDGLWDWNISKETVFFSKRWKETLGYLEHEFPDSLDAWLEILHPDDRKIMEENIENHILGKTPFFAGEHRFRCKDGRYKWLWLRGRIVAYGSDGQPLRAIGTITDISESRKLIDQLSRYRFIIENTTEEFFLVSDEGKILMVNNAAAKAHGKTKYDLENHNFSDIDKSFGKDSIPGLIERMKKEKHVSFELERTDDSGKKTFKEIRMVSIIYEGKTMICAFARDITEKMCAMNSLKESEERYKALIYHLPDVVLIHDGDRIVYANETAFTNTGYSAEEIIGSNFTDYLTEESASTVRTMLQKRLDKDETPDFYEIQIRRKDGELTDFETRAGVIDLDGKTVFLAVLTDVTARKRMELELKKEHSMLDMIVSQNPYAMAIFDKDGFYEKGNHAYQNLFSQKPTEKYCIFRDSVLEQYKPDGFTLLKKGLTVRYPDVHYTPEYNFHGGHSVDMYLDITLFGIINSRREIENYIAIIENVSKKTQMEKAIRENERLFRSYFEQPLIGLCITDASGNVTEVNSRFSEFIGKQKQEITGKFWPDFFPSAKKTETEQILRSFSRGMAESYLFESEIRKADGAAIFANISMRCVRKDDGKIYYILNVIQDITEKRNSELKLFEEKERLSVTLRSIRDGVITIDANRCIVLMNRIAESITGFDFQLSVGKKIDDVMILSDEKTGEPMNSTNDLLKFSFDSLNNDIPAQLKSAAGRSVPVECSAAPIYDADSGLTGFVIVFRDITEKRRSEDANLKTIKLESLGILAGGIAHDFNNILTTVIGNLSLARMWQSSDARISKAVSDAEKASLKAKDLTHQLLTLSKGGLPVKESASAYELIMDSIDLALHGSGITCECNIDENVSNLEIDPGQISQVLHNIMLNSRQAMNDKGTISIRCSNYDNSAKKLGNVKSAHLVSIKISDKGPGITQEIISRIFDPYFTTKQAGHGLGLAISYSIVKNHGGLIEVESEEGKGTSFTIYLPATSESVAVKVEKKMAPVKSDLRILVLEDEENISNLLSTIFTKYSITGTFTSDGEQTLKEYFHAMETNVPYNLVILDLTIPGGMGGKETIMRLHEINPDIKAIVSSGYSNDDVMSNFRKYGFSARVTKPYSVEQLIETIRDLT